MPRTIDLTLKLKPGMRGVDVAEKFRYDRDGWNASTLSLYSHCGTHMDSPFHFAAGDQTIDQIPLEHCMGDAWIVRLPETKPRELLTVAHLGHIAQQHRPGESLLFHTGWSRFVAEPKYRDELPRIGDELAQWCIDHRVRIIGVEPPSVADVNDRDEVRRIHQLLLTAGIVIVEGLTNLESIRSDKVFLMALPLPIDKCDGSPVRALAFEGGFPETHALETRS